jgi:L-ascorbate metabolism protein UlaG (beta-lactamase superfamily)
MFDNILNSISWLGHASIKIEDEKIIYIDPWEIPRDSKPADIILITHEHYDHFSPEDIKKITKNDTSIILTDRCKKNLPHKPIFIKPFETLKEHNIDIKTVPAYNIDKHFHPKTSGGVGYILTIKDIKIYHAGDTDLIPDIKHIQADIILLPIGGTYTMNVEEAAQLSNIIKPQVAIPIHYGTIVGSDEDAEKFKNSCKCPTQILKK